MDPRLQAGVELQLEKQAQQDTDIVNTDTAPVIDEVTPEDKQACVSSGNILSTMLRGVTRT